MRIKNTARAGYAFAVFYTIWISLDGMAKGSISEDTGEDQTQRKRQDNEHSFCHPVCAAAEGDDPHVICSTVQIFLQSTRETPEAFPNFGCLYSCFSI